MACKFHWLFHPSQVVLHEIVFAGGDILSSPLSQVIMSISFLWISELGFLESLRLGPSSLLVWFPRSGSVLHTATWDEVSFVGDV